MKQEKKKNRIFLLCTAGVCILLLLIAALLFYQKRIHTASTPSTTDEALKNQDVGTPGWENKKAAILDRFDVSLYGTTYTLPFAYQQLKDNGYQLLQSDTDATVPANGYYNSALYDKNRQLIAYVYFTNQTKKDLPISKCSVTGISIEFSNPDFTIDPAFTLNDRITADTSSDDAIKILGNPGDAFGTTDTGKDASDDANDVISLSWYGKNYSENFYDCLTLSYKNRKLSSITIMKS